jgi:hypothetical protein
MQITIDASDLGKIVTPADLAALMPKLTMAVGKVGADVQAGAMARSRVDTGAMRSGWQCVIEKGGDSVYATISNGVLYTVHNEYGTWKMAAQPMAIPSLDENTPAFVAAVEAILGSIL